MSEISKSVAEIIADVRARGDQALLDYTERWDGVRLEARNLRVGAEVLGGVAEESDFAAAFTRAAARIEKFHSQVKPRTSLFEDEEGVLMGMRWTPIRSVGLYVPGGKAAYPSTLAMTALPAKIAGVERIVVVSPPGPDGEISPQVLMAAKILGIEEVYRVGGAQAVAALAIGTDSIPKVDKIFGPGNAFVAEAKLQLFGEVGIDMFAGPSELVVYADGTADPGWAAADLLAQAEHDESTRVTLLASDEGVLKAVRQCVDELLEESPRRETIEISLERNGCFEVVADPGRAADRINEIAPEHLSIQVANPFSFLPLVQNAGAIFLGKESPVAIGDYFAGPNHVLPTGGTARFASCLSVEDFMKRSNLVRMSLDFTQAASRDVEELALGEGLPAHAGSVALRREVPAEERARGGLQAVPDGQYAAAKAMGMGYWQSMIYIILPQALRITIPSMVNLFIAGFKDTSLVIVISMLDLLGTANAAKADPEWLGLFIEAYVFIAAIYLAVCASMSWYSRRIERRISMRQQH